MKFGKDFIAVFKYLEACVEELTYSVLKGHNESQVEKLLVFRLNLCKYTRSFKIIRDIQQKNGPLFKKVSFLSLEMFDQTLKNVLVDGVIV